MRENEIEWKKIHFRSGQKKTHGKKSRSKKLDDFSLAIFAFVSL